MRKNQICVKDYGSGWEPNEISADLNSLCKDGWALFDAFPMTSDMEVARYPNALPGLNDGDSIIVRTDMRVILTK